MIFVFFEIFAEIRNYDSRSNNILIIILIIF